MVHRFSGNGILLDLGKAEMKILYRSLQALLSSAPSSFVPLSHNRVSQLPQKESLLSGYSQTWPFSNPHIMINVHF